MTGNDMKVQLTEMRNYFDSGATTGFEFRYHQLSALKDAIRNHEKEIFDALYSDLGNSVEEVYATESGLVLSEISFIQKRLKKWMRPARAKTNLVNFPSASRIYRDPLGVVLIIGAWNYPFQLVMNPLVGAIAGGNCAVLKPSEMAPATSSLIAKIIRATFPAEYISVFEGEGSAIIPEMMQAFRFDHIFYTGGAAVAKSIYAQAAKELIPVTLELGGKSPGIVEESANLGVAARRLVLGKFLNAGQTCVAPDYVLVHSSQKEKFLHLLNETLHDFFGDDPSASNDYGRIINERRFDHMQQFLSSGGSVVTGGNFDREQLYVSPTVITDLPAEHPLMEEEIFGPILPVIGFNNREEALSVIRRNEKPLAFYLFSGDKSAEKWWMSRVSFGGGCINNTLWQLANPHLPFGGVGGSGIGAYHGRYSFETFTHAKPVMKTPAWFDPAFKYPPFSGRLRLFKWFMR